MLEIILLQRLLFWFTVQCKCEENLKGVLQSKQELSYRKHIARKLHTQYVKAINRPKYYNVTLKCRLRVTQLDRSYTTDY